MATTYVGVRIQGGLLPAELLSRLTAGDPELGGLDSAAYHLAAQESVREAANRSWAYLTGVWTAYRAALVELPEADWATTLTRERWMTILLNELGYGRVPLTSSGGIQVGDKAFPISHHWEHIPIHLLGARVPLDKRTPGLAGAATSSPQSMLQELLNRSEDRLWGILSNGNTLRLLRDSTALVGSAYVEFDLDAIFDGDLFSDFVLLYTLCHQSRIEIRNPSDGAVPQDCWLEEWRQSAVDSGSRALEQLRDGVVSALTELGTGFLAHPANGDLREHVADRSLSLDDLNHSLLRLVYRLLFTFVAEDRGVLLSPDASPDTRERYVKYFSTERLRRVARRRRGGRHGDLWHALTLVWRGLGTAEGRPELGITPIGGLFEPGELDVLDHCELSNQTVLTAVRMLSLMTEPRSGVKRIVDYRNLGAEELGSIYEALLEYVPRWDPASRRYSLGGAAGNARKTTGSYYTPTSLIEALLDTALDPVLDRAAKSDDAERAYLALTVCDPACGSGHFLVAAARRIAKRVAALRSGDPEPPPEVVRAAMSDVVSRCIYGVDLNPLAAELAKVSLWLETMDPGKPLAYLDAQIKVGNSLIGATPELLADGIPDGAFQPIEGDEKSVISSLKKRNAQERGGAQSLFDEEAIVASNQGLAQGMRDVVAGRPLSLADVQVRRKRLADLQESADYRRQRHAADAWCAAFVWAKTRAAPPAVTHEVLLRFQRGDPIAQATTAEVERLASEYRFFHWHLEFPQIFRTGRMSASNELAGWHGGFDAVLGNPPWERIALEDKQFFATRAPEVLETGTTAARKRAIDALESTQPAVYEEYINERNSRAALGRFLSASGLYPLSGGRLTTHNLFAELSRRLVGAAGRIGLVLPTSVITDVPMQRFWRDLVDRQQVEAVVDFENAEGLFVGVHRSYNFMLFVCNSGAVASGELRVGTYLRSVSDLARPGRVFQFPIQVLGVVNPLTKQLPTCRTQKDIDLLTSMTLAARSDRVDATAWVGFTSEATSADFKAQAGPGLVGLYEGKLMHQYDARFSTYEGSSVAERRDGKPKAVPWTEKGAPIEFRHHVERKLVGDFLRRKGVESASWVLVVRDYARATDERTVIAAAVPRTVPVQPLNGVTVVGDQADSLQCLAIMNTFAYDWTARQRVSGMHFNVTTMAQTPVPRISLRWRQRAIEHAAALSRPTCPEVMGPPELIGEHWAPIERENRRAELDAIAFLEFGVSREDVSYIMDSFATTRAADFRQYGEYRTKRLVLKAYDAMQAAIESGVSYRSPWDSVSFGEENQ